MIVDPGQACPALIDGAKRTATTPRRNPHGFAVKVCEARYPFGRSLAVEGGPKLPAVVEKPSRIAVLGDSGCKPKDQQGCGLDDPEWPFPALAKAAAASRPDLVLHVGDYNYRGTPSGFKVTVDGKEVQRWYYDAGDGANPRSSAGFPVPTSARTARAIPTPTAGKRGGWTSFSLPAIS